MSDIRFRVGGMDLGAKSLRMRLRCGLELPTAQQAAPLLSCHFGRTDLNTLVLDLRSRARSTSSSRALKRPKQIDVTASFSEVVVTSN